MVVLWCLLVGSLISSVLVIHSHLVPRASPLRRDHACDSSATTCLYTQQGYSRERSCLDLCSDRENALEQNWHLYFFSFADAVSPLALATLRPTVGETGWSGCARAAVADIA